jgi:D-amino-acid oxidase
MSSSDAYIVIGAGVIGLTTALELKSQYPASSIKILATHLPGDRSISYTSPWAGANWLSVATDNGRQEEWDLVTYKKLEKLAHHVPHSGVKALPIRAFYDSALENAGILSEETRKIWYESLTGLRMLEDAEVEVNAKGAKFGYECSSFVIDVQIYLPW